jgi:hypothetical protein
MQDASAGHLLLFNPITVTNATRCAITLFAQITLVTTCRCVTLFSGTHCIFIWKKKLPLSLKHFVMKAYGG